VLLKMIGEVIESLSDGVERFLAMIFKLTDEIGDDRPPVGFIPHSLFFAAPFAGGIGIIDPREQFSVTIVNCACSRSCHIAPSLLHATFYRDTRILAPVVTCIKHSRNHSRIRLQLRAT
jgi:hypothetical protein